MLPRSYLYVPADNERFLEKAETSEADVVILDLEDSISASNKARARSLALDFLNKTNRKGIALRVNPIAVNDEIKLINHKKIDRIFL
ncbi:MAG: CoA ester lyase, partial [Actinobacteria bacterium]|nr:CoA ester lyase [Actinomycetota bacterium]